MNEKQAIKELQDKIITLEQKNDKLESALLKLATRVDGLAWRIASEEEWAPINIVRETKEALAIKEAGH
jgi:hypothetical protein